MSAGVLPKDILICLDPGHAENTPGKESGGFKEYAGNRRVARKLKVLLERVGFKVIYSCDLDSPNDLSLEARAEAARRAGAHLFISIHTNAASPSVRGTETFIHDNSQASLSIARLVQACLVEAIGQANRGVKRANFGVLRGTYQHMLSILTEAEFFTNADARKWMFQESFDDAYAGAVFKGVCQFYDVDTAKAPPKVPAPIQTDDIGSAIVRVKVDSLWVYDKPDWNARTFTVKKHEAFTVVRELTVKGFKMYQLKSGLFITANEDYVELDGVIKSTEGEKAPVKAVHYLNLKPLMSSWRVYDLKSPVRAGQEKAKLNPKKFGGLSYEILDNPQKDVYTIQTNQFGKVNIYAPRDIDSTITQQAMY